MSLFPEQWHIHYNLTLIIINALRKKEATKPSKNIKLVPINDTKCN